LALVDISNGYGMDAFLMINKIKGGTTDNIQPGLDAIKTLVDQGGPVLVSTNPEILSEFSQNDAWLAGYGSDYAYTLKQAGLPIKFVQPAEGTPAEYVTVNLVAGRPNRDLALKFIDMSISKEAQECFTKALRYSPTNKEVELPPDVAVDVVYGEKAISGLIRLDPRAIEANRPKWVEAWKKVISK
jgi:putative spermidine/putrescine transport system substrate-binding protein